MVRSKGSRHLPAIKRFLFDAKALSLHEFGLSNKNSLMKKHSLFVGNPTIFVRCKSFAAPLAYQTKIVRSKKQSQFAANQSVSVRCKSFTASNKKVEQQMIKYKDRFRIYARGEKFCLIITERNFLKCFKNLDGRK